MEGEAVADEGESEENGEDDDPNARVVAVALHLLHHAVVGALLLHPAQLPAEVGAKGQVLVKVKTCQTVFNFHDGLV